MDIRTRIIGRYIETLPDGQEYFDVTSFLLRLLLFDKLIIQSSMLEEFVSLVKLFGYDSVLALLQSKAIEIDCEVRAIAQTGQIDFLKKRREKGVLPLGSYCFDYVRIPNREDYIHRSLQNIHGIPGLNLKQVIKLKQHLVSNILLPKPNIDEDAIKQFRLDLASNTPIAKTTIVHSINQKLNITAATSDFNFKIHSIDKEDFATETDIPAMFNLNDVETNEIVQRSLLSVGSLNHRISEMKGHIALAGFREEEMIFFEQKLDFACSFVAAEEQEKRFQRVLAVTGFQDLVPLVQARQVDLLKLLDVRTTKECREFREWLWSVDSTTEAEIQDRFTSIRERLSWFAHGKGGKAVRWLASIGIGLVPGGTVAGAGLGFLDTFLLEKVLPQSGALAFLSKFYPSIFKENPRITPQNFLKSLDS